MSVTPEETHGYGQALFANADCEAGYRAAISRIYYGCLHAGRLLADEQDLPLPPGDHAPGSHNLHILRLKNPPARMDYGCRAQCIRLGEMLNTLRAERVTADYILDEHIEHGHAETISVTGQEAMNLVERLRHDLRAQASGGESQ